MRMTHTSLAALLVAIAAVAPAQQSIRTTVDGSLVAYPDVEPVMMNGRVMVPLRGVFEHMGAYVEWDGLNNEVRVTDDGTVVLLTIGSSIATVNGSVLPIDSPAILYQGRTMVPLRFISESFGHDVYWNAPIRTVEITTIAARPTPTPGYLIVRHNTVVPFKLRDRLSSSTSNVGDRFTATLDTRGGLDYEGLPVGTVLQGHVETVRARTADAPGVIGLAFDRIRMPNGSTYPIDGSLIGLDKSSVTNNNGVLYAKSDAPNDLKYVGYGAAAGVLLAISTHGNVLTDTVIGAALGYLFGLSQVDKTKYNNVTLAEGTAFGVRLDRDLQFRPGTTQ